MAAEPGISRSVVATIDGRRFSFRLNAPTHRLPAAPLIIAIHGGSYDSSYFDVPGFSLLARAGVLGIPAVAIDRPAYGDSEARSLAEHSHAATVALLAAAIPDLLARYGAGCPGVVLIGHSIGGAIAAGLAARQPGWLLGVALSGVGLTPAAGDEEAWQGLPDIPLIDFPPALKDSKMFGPPSTYAPDAPQKSHVADAPATRQELVDIVTIWPQQAPALLQQIRVPLHYRQAEFDAMWQVSEAGVSRFAAACSGARFVDAALVRGSGHCIDFHHVGAVFQLGQLGFALGCGADALTG